MKPRLLLATDFDGTIAPIVSHPDDAVISPLAEALLRKFADREGVALAIISGRDLADVRTRIGGIAAIVAGSHGLECEDAAGRALWTARTSLPEPPDALCRELEASGFLIERKKFAVAVHFRGSDVAATSRRLQPFTAWAREHDLALMPGRKVLEARVRGGGKRAALRAIAAHVGADRIVYAGDDTTDFPALAFAAERGRAVFVQSSERTAPDIASLSVARSIEDLCCFLTLEIDGDDRGAR